MFVGHLALALGAKAAEPRVPLGSAVAAVFALDLIWPLMLLAGAESVIVAPGNTAFTPLDFVHYPWTHSLAMAIAWSLLAGALGKLMSGSGRVAWILGLLVASHWLLDFVTHRPDLALWPGGPLTGLGLWNSVPATIAVEGSLYIAAIWLYVRNTSALDRTGIWALTGLLLLCGLIWVSSPWSPPPPSASAIAYVGLASWLFPLWAMWIDRHRKPALSEE